MDVMPDYEKYSQENVLKRIAEKENGL